MLLAGALTPENVGTAVRAARPWAVDAVRGTEAAPGIKDHDRLRAFCARRQGGGDMTTIETPPVRRPTGRTRSGASGASAGASCPRR